MTNPTFRALCAELLSLLDNLAMRDPEMDGGLLRRRARIALGQPEPVADGQEPDAFAIVQMRLDDLAGDQELMIYRYPNGDWSIDHTNPESSVQLGETSGVYNSTGRILEDVVFALAAQLSANNTKEKN
jgi:hypothetical protein